MTRHPLSFRHRVIAGTSALALGLVSALGAAAAANAVQVPNTGLIDESRTGTLTIVKRAAGANTAGSIDGQDEGTGTPLAGAQFVIHKIDGTDLKTTAGWEKVDALKRVNLMNACANADAPTLNGYTFSDPKTTSLTAAGTGKTTPVSGLALSAYLVCEKVKPAQALKPAAPFIVTVPTPFDNGTTPWLYDITVYPKNVVTNAPTKTQTIDANATLGIADHVKFAISAVVPAIDVKEHFSMFTLADPLPGGFEDIKITGVTLAEAGGGNPVTVTETTHYTKNIVQDKHWAQIIFTRDGLNLLKQNAGKTVTMSLAATVKTLPDGVADRGVLKNTGYLMFDTVIPGGDEPPQPTTPPMTPPDNPGDAPKVPDTPGTPPLTPTNNDVYSKWGGFQIPKVNQGHPDQVLPGAEFQVFVAKDQYAAECTSRETTGEALTFKSPTGTTQTLVTDAQGLLVVPGVLIDQKSVASGQDAGLQSHRCLVLVETKAPAGYVKPSGENAKTPIKITGGMSTSDTVISNTQQGVPELPVTGASGQLLLTVGGVALLLFASGGYLVNRRRSAQK